MIKNTMDTVSNSVSTGFSNLWNWLNTVVNSITELPSKIWLGFTDVCKTLFVPSDSYFSDSFSSVKDKFVAKFPNSNLSDLSNLNGESAFSDVYVTILGTRSKIIDASFIVAFRDQLQKWTSGLVGFLLLVYNFNQIVFMIRGTYPINLGGFAPTGGGTSEAPPPVTGGGSREFRSGKFS